MVVLCVAFWNFIYTRTPSGVSRLAWRSLDTVANNLCQTLMFVFKENTLFYTFIILENRNVLVTRPGELRVDRGMFGILGLLFILECLGSAMVKTLKKVFVVAPSMHSIS